VYDAVCVNMVHAVDQHPEEVAGRLLPQPALLLGYPAIDEIQQVTAAAVLHHHVVAVGGPELLEHAHLHKSVIIKF